jgi:hypothetical protein
MTWIEASSTPGHPLLIQVHHDRASARCLCGWGLSNATTLKTVRDRHRQHLQKAAGQGGSAHPTDIQATRVRDTSAPVAPTSRNIPRLQRRCWDSHAVVSLAATQGANMASQHTPADDIVYDLVSIQYHALQAAQTYGKYLEDTEGHEDVAEFIRQCQQQDSDRAMRCHELLAQLTKSGIG